METDSSSMVCKGVLGRVHMVRLLLGGRVGRMTVF